MRSVFCRAKRAAAVSLFALGASISAAAVAPGCSSAESAAPNNVCPPGQTCQTRLTLLHTSDIHSRLLPYDLLVTQVDANLGLGTNGQLKNVGGVARMAYVIGRERARADRVLHLDSGDAFQGAPIFNFFAGEPEVRAMSALGTDAQVIGNHEFDRGALNVARQLQRWANFPVLGANYSFNDARDPSNTSIGNVLTPFEVFTENGLKIAVIGMGNLSSLTSVFDQPNRLGITPLNTVEVAQFYVDLLRPYVDVVVMLTHLGLEVDQRMIRSTTGIDVVLGGHNHIVINPPQQLQDCSVDALHPGYIWAVDPNLTYDTNKPAPNDDLHPDPVNHPYMFKRACKPRKVVLAHSGAFAKYVGRLDLILSNDPKEISPDGDPAHYEPINGFEVASSRYQAFPIDDSIPSDPVVSEMLEPYRRTLDRVADLDILVGYSPQGSKRSAAQGGDSPLGNLVATAMWLRLGIQTDFSLTNTTGIRTDLNPGPVSIEQMYNIFPFDNSISKMQLSGLEVQQLFDFAARRSSGRGCVSQAQIAGARVRINCAGCNRPEANKICAADTECIGGQNGSCRFQPDGSRRCVVEACAEAVFIGHASPPDNTCNTDVDCAKNGDDVIVGQCDKADDGTPGTCSSPIAEQNLYELATSNYLAAGGSGYRVLQRNTTQFDTLIQQRDALIDYLRQGNACGYRAAADRPDGLKACATDGDCATEGDFVCACPGKSHEANTGGILTCETDPEGCDPAAGRCVRRDCRTQVAQVHENVCASSPSRDACKIDLNACSISGEECKFLSCVDQTVGNFSDNRVEMLGR
jgi:5'-nucleotidase/UDP-sugar diphosphatase